MAKLLVKSTIINMKRGKRVVVMDMPMPSYATDK